MNPSDRFHDEELRKACVHDGHRAAGFLLGVLLGSVVLVAAVAVIARHPRRSWRLWRMARNR